MVEVAAMNEYVIEVPYPGNSDCPGCSYYSEADQCCTAVDAEECAQVNGLD